jgi:hypothetical protein
MAPPGGRSNNIFGDSNFETQNAPVKNGGSTAANNKPVELTAQQEAAANRNHNQQSSMMFGDDSNNRNNNAKVDHRTVADAASVKNKQRSTYNPITGQSHEEEDQQRETIKQKHISYQQNH